MITRLLLAVVLLGPAAGESASALERAEAAAMDGRFDDAAAAFGEAYAESGEPSALFGQAQSLKRAGRCADAIAAFEQFLSLSPPKADADAAQSAIDECNPQREPVPPPVANPVAPEPTPAEPAVQSTPPSPKPPSPEDSPQPWYKDRLGGALLGVGVGGVAVGAGLYGAAFAVARNSPNRESERDYEDRDRRASNLAGAGITLLAVGVAVTVGAVVRYVVVSRRGRSGRAARRRGQGRGLSFRPGTPRFGRAPAR